MAEATWLSVQAHKGRGVVKIFSNSSHDAVENRNKKATRKKELHRIDCPRNSQCSPAKSPSLSLCRNLMQRWFHQLE